jgi:hypothetical protein
LAPVYDDDGFLEEKAVRVPTFQNIKPQDENSAVFLFDFNLIQIELHPAVAPFQKVDSVNPVFFVIVEHFYILVFQQIQIDFVSVVANTHDKSPLEVESLDLLMQGQLAEFFPTHEFYFSTKT